MNENIIKLMELEEESTFDVFTIRKWISDLKANIKILESLDLKCPCIILERDPKNDNLFPCGNTIRPTKDCIFHCKRTNLYHHIENDIDKHIEKGKQIIWELIYKLRTLGEKKEMKND